MKILSYNINGIRAAIKKDFIPWLKAVNADIVCLQEIKATDEQVDLSVFKKIGYSSIIWNAAEKKGYSGTAILSKQPPVQYHTRFNRPVIDTEGRLIIAHYPELTVVNAYFPSGASKYERQQIKLRFLSDYKKIILPLKEQKTLLCGDFNICRQAIDIHDPIRLNGVPGFTPEERNWMNELITREQFSDAFRMFNSLPHQYTWWSYMAKARERNAGWRIDYHLVSHSLTPEITDCKHLTHAKHSDHCPVLLKINE